MSTPPYGSLPTVIDPTAWAGRTVNYPLTIDSIQNQIAAQLTSYFASGGLDISTYIWPNFDLDTWWNSSAIAFVLISYKSSQYSKPMSVDTMLQERTISFSIHVEARQIAWPLTGPGSVYALIDAIEASLQGFQPFGCRNGYFTDERFHEQDPQGRVWLYDMNYNIITMRPKLDPNYVLASLIQATTNVQPSGDQVIVVPGQTSPING